MGGLEILHPHQHFLFEVFFHLFCHPRAFPNHLYPSPASVFPCPSIVGDDTVHSVSTRGCQLSNHPILAFALAIVSLLVAWLNFDLFSKF
jgi:hypothetical protein